jgi:hypothetical protein
MRFNWISTVFVSAGLMAFALPAQAQTFRAATRAEAVDIVTADDGYMRNLTLADLSIRLQNRDGGTPAQLKAQFEAAVTPWTEAETARLDAMVARNSEKLAGLSAWLPEQVLFIKGGRGIDGGLPHTRAHAIVFGPSLPTSEGGLESLFFHELFHVLSRHASPTTRESLYGLIGFERCASVTIPPALRARGVSNPDVEDGAFTVEVQGGGDPVDLMPFLTASPERFDPAKPSFPSYFQLLFLNIKRGPNGSCALVTATGVTSIFSPGAVQAPLFAKVGRNTNYVFHAEETLADNFAYLMTGRTDLPDMWVIEKLKERLARGPG